MGRRPVVTPEDIVAALVPPPHFSDATFATYSPDPQYPSQLEAQKQAREFATGAKKRLLKVTPSSSAGKGLYLDGGFGVGKTHLLAAMAHEVGQDAAFGTFVEYTHLVGALGFQSARQALQNFRLVCIDEFELDDPGDTLIMARLMRELADAGVALAATSNTLPDSLGHGRFAADEFRREIQALARVFDVASIDGPDFRRRGDIEFPDARESVSAEELAGDRVAVESWPALVEDLSHVHPSRLSSYVSDIQVLGLNNVAPLTDQNSALRVVALVDRLYDADVRIVAAGGSLGDIFPEEMLRGGFRKKYFRALSRLAAMAQTDSLTQVPAGS